MMKNAWLPPSGGRHTFQVDSPSTPFTYSNGFPLPSRAAPALAVRVRLPRSGKSARLILSLRSLTRRVGMRLGDRCEAELLPVVI